MDTGAPAGLDDGRLLSGTPESSHQYLSLDDYTSDRPTSGYETPDLIPRKRCQFEVSLSTRSVVDRWFGSEVFVCGVC